MHFVGRADIGQVPEEAGVRFALRRRDHTLLIILIIAVAACTKGLALILLFLIQVDGGAGNVVFSFLLELSLIIRKFLLLKSLEQQLNQFNHLDLSLLHVPDSLELLNNVDLTLQTHILLLRLILSQIIGHDLFEDAEEAAGEEE